mmetsp:Transcript_6264/g.12427  ORF Transcript_6264/g.12427 Transcript_6264/m.12427 type:complete len:144 (+) Transcript_6264:65-496(+)
MELLKSLRLDTLLDELRGRKLRSTFNSSVADLLTEDAPIKARCPGGSLVEVLMMPQGSEGGGEYDRFDERLLRSALALRELEPTEPPIPQPEWVSVEQPWADESDRKKKRKSKKKKKRRRNHPGCEGDGEDEERRKRKKVKEG